MEVNLSNFNRIIDLEFYTRQKYDSRGFLLNAEAQLKQARSIICPRYGIKPQIEINGTFGAALALQAFHITIKNLYFDLLAEPYSHIKVTAGYANNNTTFEADILNMYQDSPGPDGTTVIECVLGNVTQRWLDSFVSLHFEKGTYLSEILNYIGTKLMASDVTTGDEAKKLRLDTEFQFDGSARNALAELEQRFKGNFLQIIMQGSTLCAICVTDGDFVNSRRLEYMSAPPQRNPGDEKGNWKTMITAPWMPDLRPGDMLEIPNQIYLYKGTYVGGLSETQKMVVTEMSFHFGTRGSVNQMTCTGYIKR